VAALANVGLDTPSLTTNIPQETGGSDAVNPSINNDLAPPVWLSDTDLVFVPGTNRLILTMQTPPVWAVIHDAFDNAQASLFFDHAFPDATMMPIVLRGCFLIAAAESCNPMAPEIHRQLTHDNRYLNSLSCLVSDS